MTISAVVTETEINASVTQLSNSVALTETEINASVSQTPISASVSSSPVSASVTAATTISVAVSQTNISASISSSGGVTDHALLSNLSYALSGHTGFQATLTADVDYLTPATAALTYQPIGSYLTDAPSDGTTYGRNNATWTAVSSGVTNHALLSNLDYASAGHTGFQAALSFPLTPDLGGTGIANLAGSTLTLGGATTISTGGTIALGGYTLTVPATGTAALLATANTFTIIQTISSGVNEVALRVGNAAGSSKFTAMQQWIDEAGTYNSWSINRRGELRVFSIQNSTGDFSVLASAHLYISSGSTKNIYFNLNRDGNNFFATSGKNVFGEIVAPISLYPTKTTMTDKTTTTNAVLNVLELRSYVSTASTGGAAGFGVGVNLSAETATDGQYKQIGYLTSNLIVATTASYTGRLAGWAVDYNGQREGWRVDSDGSQALLGFYAHAAVAQQVLATGAGATVDNVITALQALGLVKQS